MLIYLLRHGLTEYNAQKLSGPARTGSWRRA